MGHAEGASSHFCLLGGDEMSTELPGPPVKNVIESTPASPNKIAKAIFRAADKRISKSK